MADEQVARHVFVFNPKENGGESLSLETKFIDNGDRKTLGPEKGIYTVQTLTLASYCNAAHFELFGAFTPDNLRQLANELDEVQSKL